MSKVISYIRESRNELLHKVTWPTMPELMQSSVVVLVASLIIALIVFAMDSVFENLIKLFYGIN
ncbi:MAG TPA: preprotein translocase subunit SecE [Anseongella sp.]